MNPSVSAGVSPDDDDTKRYVSLAQDINPRLWHYLGKDSDGRGISAVCGFTAKCWQALWALTDQDTYAPCPSCTKPSRRPPTQTMPEPPTRWGADMTVMHRLTGSQGIVNSVDFDEDLVYVEVGEYVLTWRIENVFEVSS